jgi:Rieske Fe-S protein
MKPSSFPCPPRARAGHLEAERNLDEDAVLESRCCVSSSNISRRHFCALSGLTVLSVSAGCGDTGTADDGGVSGGDGGANPDLAPSGSGSCKGAVNAGPASAIAMGQAKHLSSGVAYDLYVCRDAGGLYALTAICTHAGCTVSHGATRFTCPCHGATFDLNGQNPTSPAHFPLDHFALCIDANGNVIVDPNTTVSPTTRS